MSETKAKFDAVVTAFQENFEKFTEKGNKSAGTRARKSLMEISKLSKELRKEIQDEKISGQ